MNEHIDFKVWHMPKKKMYIPKNIAFMKKGFWVTVDDPEIDPDGFMDDNENFKLLQYTGLKDSKGNKVYHGDIIKIDRGDSFSSFNVGEVIFLHGAFKLLDAKEAPKIWNVFDSIKCINDKKYGAHFLTNWPILEVLGNVFEDVGLLVP